jgi:integrase
MRRRYRLNAAKVAAIRKPGRHADGGNLILRVSKDGHKTWAFRFALGERERVAGLGPLHRVSLAEARAKAEAMGKLLAAGLDPLVERDKARTAERAAAARLLTFREAAKRYVADREGSWRNEQHRKDFRNSLDTHVLPVIGGLSVADVDTPMVLKVLENDNFWRTNPQTANNCRSRIELILDWCRARGHRNGENPAAWRGHLDKILPAPKTLAPTKHHAALPWQQVPGFMTDLRGREGMVARALEFTILNASRIGEVLGATWSELDFAAKTWTIPAARMKSNREHVVPLSPRALEILRSLPREGERPFPTHRATVSVFLRDRMGRDVTIHGFRSSFSTWCAEATRFEPAVREAALAHVIKDKVERSYQRGTMLQKRRAMMDAWTGYCSSPPAKTGTTVVPIRGVASKPR